MFHKTKIICTIGPASEDIGTLRKLIAGGMNIARLNFSHGTHQEHGQRIQNIRQAAREENQVIAILLDTKGPEIRTGLVEQPIELHKGNQLTLTTQEIIGTSSRISVSYQGLPQEVHPGSIILVDDGLIELQVEVIQENEIHCRVQNGGILTSRKGINIPELRVNLPGITEKDAQDIQFGIEYEVDFIAASFVRKPQDVLEIRKILEEHRAPIQIISKIENREGIDNVDSILDISDGLMVARGDMGVEIEVEEVPLVQKELIKKANLLGKPVITATQMLDSMQRNPRPTRAESSDVANAIFDGTDAVMLSGETAAGLYPVEAVRTMSQIVLRTERALGYKDILDSRVREMEMSITNSISQAVVHTSYSLDSSAIITATESGHTARMVSKYRPMVPIIAVTPHQSVLQQLTLIWGVYPILCSPVKTTDELFQTAITMSLESGLVNQGDLVVISAGAPVGQAGTTNVMKVHVMSGMLASGKGIGKKIITGKVICGVTADEIREQMVDNAIIVTLSTDKEMIDLVERASAVITEEGGLTSHAAVVGISLGIPVVVGVENALNLLRNEKVITVDSSRGHIYAGKASVI